MGLTTSHFLPGDCFQTFLCAGQRSRWWIWLETGSRRCLQTIQSSFNIFIFDWFWLPDLCSFFHSDHCCNAGGFIHRVSIASCLHHILKDLGWDSGTPYSFKVDHIGAIFLCPGDENHHCHSQRPSWCRTLERNFRNEKFKTTSWILAFLLWTKQEFMSRFSCSLCPLRAGEAFGNSVVQMERGRSWQKPPDFVLSMCRLKA